MVSQEAINPWEDSPGTYQPPAPQRQGGQRAPSRPTVPGWYSPARPTHGDPRPAADVGRDCAISIGANAAAPGAVPLTADTYEGNKLPFIRLAVGSIATSIAGRHGRSTREDTTGKARHDAITEALVQWGSQFPEVLGMDDVAHERASPQAATFAVFDSGAAGQRLMDDIVTDGRVCLVVNGTPVQVAAKRVVKPDTREASELVIRHLTPGEAMCGVTEAMLTEAGYPDVEVIHERMGIFAFGRHMYPNPTTVVARVRVPRDDPLLSRMPRFFPAGPGSRAARVEVTVARISMVQRSQHSRHGRPGVVRTSQLRHDTRAPLQQAASTSLRAHARQTQAGISRTQRSTRASRASPHRAAAPPGEPTSANPYAALADLDAAEADSEWPALGQPAPTPGDGTVVGTASTVPTAPRPATVASRTPERSTAQPGPPPAHGIAVRRAEDAGRPGASASEPQPASASQSAAVDPAHDAQVIGTDVRVDMTSAADSVAPRGAPALPHVHASVAQVPAGSPMPSCAGTMACAGPDLPPASTHTAPTAFPPPATTAGDRGKGRRGPSSPSAAMTQDAEEAGGTASVLQPAAGATPRAGVGPAQDADEAGFHMRSNLTYVPDSATRRGAQDLQHIDPTVAQVSAACLELPCAGDTGVGDRAADAAGSELPAPPCCAPDGVSTRPTSAAPPVRRSTRKRQPAAAPASGFSGAALPAPLAAPAQPPAQPRHPAQVTSTAAPQRGGRSST